MRLLKSVGILLLVACIVEAIYHIKLSREVDRQMDAKICDRCGKIIKSHLDLYRVTISTCDKKGIQRSKRELDLCGNCHIKLTGFLKEEK